jgi:spermidine synthase
MTRNHLTLFLVGAALSIAQFIMIRDFVSILYGEEVVIVLVTASFFLGLSAGYLLSLRLSRRMFEVLRALAIFLHLSFPFSYRYIAAWLSQVDASGYWFLVLLFFYALLFNTIFAVFLPRLITLEQDSGRSEGEKLRVYYALELAGFMSGFFVVIFSWVKPFAWLMVPYWVILGVVLHLVLRRAWLTGAYALVALPVILNLQQIDYGSTALLYRYKHHMPGAETLYSENSPYQKVEVLKDGGGGLHLYLDGLQNLNSTNLEGLNYIIARVPAALVRPRKALLIGNGTLSSVPKIYPFSGEVASVELDPGVLKAGRLFFTPPEKLKGLERWSLQVDDGKHFLRHTRERYDLIIVDVPSPLTIQEAYLHSMEFYALVNERLTDNGVLAVQLSGPLQRNDRTPARVTAALRQVFPEVMAIYSRRADRGFAYASRHLPFDGNQVRQVSRNYDRRLKVIAPTVVDRYLEKAVPMSVNHMDLVLRRGWERFVGRYFE